MNGDRFFYSNRLAALPKEIETNPHGFNLERQPWFDVACCPTNIVRFLPSIPGFIYSKNKTSVSINLYIQSKVVIDFYGGKVTINQKNSQPWDDKCSIEVDNESKKDIRLFLRVPYWSKKIKIKLNNKLQKIKTSKGYCSITIPMSSKSKLDIDLGMEINLVDANPNVRQNFGKQAIQRGPIIYCMEEFDNGVDLHKISLNKKSLKAKKGLLNDYAYTFLLGNARKADKLGWNKKLYSNQNIKNSKIRKLNDSLFFMGKSQSR